MPVDLDLDRVQRAAGQLLGRHPVVRKQAQVPLPRSLETLDVLLDTRQIPIALVREKYLASDDTHVGPHQIALSEERDDLVGITGMLEGAGEQVAEAGGHRQERHREPHGGLGGGTQGRVAADRHEMRERRAARFRPLDQLTERAKRLQHGRVAFVLQALAHVARDRKRPAGARARRHDDLNQRRHLAGGSGANAGHRADQRRRRSRT